MKTYIIATLVSLFAITTCVATKFTEMSYKNATWGSPEVVLIRCSKEEIPSDRNVFWKKNDNTVAWRYDGSVQYSETIGNAVTLNDDGSLSLRNDYIAEATYECAYSRPNMPYAKTQTSVSIKDPLFRILQCNTTDTNRSAPCHVNVPSGTETLRVTLIKAGLNATLNATFKVNHSLGITVAEELINKTVNEDNSVTITKIYELDVTGLLLSANIQFSFVAGRQSAEVKEMVLIKAQKIQGDNRPLTTGATTGITLFVIFAVICFVVVAVLLWRKRNGALIEQPNSGTGAADAESALRFDG